MQKFGATCGGLKFALEIGHLELLRWGRAFSPQPPFSLPAHLARSNGFETGPGVEAIEDTSPTLLSYGCCRRRQTTHNDRLSYNFHPDSCAERQPTGAAAISTPSKIGPPGARGVALEAATGHKKRWPVPRILSTPSKIGPPGARGVALEAATGHKKRWPVPRIVSTDDKKRSCVVQVGSYFRARARASRSLAFAA